MRLAISWGAFTRTSSARSANLVFRTFATLTLPNTFPSVSSTVTMSPSSMVSSGNS